MQKIFQHKIQNMTKKIIFIIIVVLISAITGAVLIPFIIKKIREHSKPEDHTELYIKLQHEYDSLGVVKSALELQNKQKQVLVDSLLSSAKSGEIKYVYLNGKRNERYKDITTATPTKQDSFMGTIHIKTTGN